VVPHRRNGDRRRAAVRLVGGGVLLYLALAAVGLAITKLTELKFLLTEDSRIAQWFFEQRTPALNTVTHVGTMLSDTITAIALTAVLFVAFRLWLHRWHESFVLMASILGELFVFLLVTNTVDRKRPPVPHLDPAPPTSSFPSGHTAAAVALYGCLAVILVRTMVNRSLARVLAILCWCVPVVVALSRMYRGMHYLSDVTFGAIGGGIWLAIVLTTLSVNGSRDRRVAQSTSAE
jgi:undecaprenyl-diphosphatase